MKHIKQILSITMMSFTLTSCISFNIKLPPQPGQRPAPSVPEVIPSPAGSPQTPTTPPPITDLNSPTSSMPADTTTPTTTQTTSTTTTAVDTSPPATSNVIPVGKGIAPINTPPLKKKPTQSGTAVLPQPNMQ